MNRFFQWLNSLKCLEINDQHLTLNLREIWNVSNELDTIDENV